MTDAEIIALFWARSERAVANVSAAYGRYLYKVAFNVLFVGEDAEECVNDTYHTAWNQMPPDRPARLLPYLGRITRCLALNRLDYRLAEKRGANSVVCLDELGECLPASEAESPEAHCEGAELARCVTAFLRGLDEEKRVMFVRRYWYLDDIASIAAHFGVSKGAVKSTLFRVRRQLKKYLEGEGYCV